MKKKLLAITLAVFMALSLLSAMAVTARADDGDPELYDLWVGGVQVTSENLVIDSEDDNAISGKATFTPANAEEETPATLTLEGFGYSGNGYLYSSGNVTIRNAIYYNESTPLTVEVKGENSIACTGIDNRYNDSYGIYVGNSTLTISGDGSLTVTGNTGALFNAVTFGQDIFAQRSNNTNGSSPANYTSGGDPYFSILGVRTYYKWFHFVHSYPLWVGGTQVTIENKENILGNSTASFTPKTEETPATLTLTDAEITAGYSQNGITAAIYYSGSDPLTISTEGVNTVARTGGSGTRYGIYLSNEELQTADTPLIITGDGMLTVIGTAQAVNTAPSLDPEADLIAWGSTDNTPTWVDYNKDDNDSYVQYQTGIFCDLWVGSTPVTTANKDDVLGNNSVSYDPDTHTLTLTGANINTGHTDQDGYSAAIYYCGSDDFTVNTTSTSTVSLNNGNDSYGVFLSNADAALTISGEGRLTVVGGGQALSKIPVLGDNIFARVSTTANGNNANDYTPGASVDTYRWFQTDESYSLWVNDIPVNSTNKGNVLGNNGTARVSYNPDTHTLTLRGANINVGHLDKDNNSAAIYYSGSEPLTINATGRETTVSQTGNNTSRNYYGIYSATADLIVTGDSTDGMTVIGSKQAMNVAPTVDGVIAIATSDVNGTEPAPEKYDANNNDSYKWFRFALVEYGLWVDNVRVNSDNMDNVLSDDGTPAVTYDPDSNTLNLNGAEITKGHQLGYFQSYGAICYNGSDPLIVNVTGTNTVSLTSNSLDDITARYGIFSTADDLTITGDGSLTVSGFNSYPIYQSGGALNLQSFSTLPLDSCGIISVEASQNLDGSDATALTPDGDVYSIDNNNKWVKYSVGYPLWVGEEQATSEKLEFEGTSGTATFDPASNTLTLTDFNFADTGHTDADSGDSAAIYYCGSDTLVISVSGKNAVEPTDDSGCGIFSSQAPLTISAEEPNTAELSAKGAVAAIKATAIELTDPLGVYTPEGGTYSDGIIKDGETIATEALIKIATITFDPGEGTGEMASVIWQPGTDYKLPANSFTAPAGQEFDQWQIGTDTYDAGDTYKVNADTTVTAIWKDITPENNDDDNNDNDNDDNNNNNNNNNGGGGGGGTTPPAPIDIDDEDVPLDGSPFDNCPKDATCPISKFTDASPTAWYHDGVHYVLDKGIMQGVGEDKFAPNAATTRAMIVTMLWRMEGSPVVNYAMTFTDVPADIWYTESVRWAASNEIVKGYSDTAFGPMDDVTREQLAAILYRYAQFKDVDVSVGEDTNILSYDDALSISDWAMPAMQWACGSGIIKGKTESTLAPVANATRAEVATMLMRLCEDVMK